MAFVTFPGTQLLNPSVSEMAGVPCVPRRWLLEPLWRGLVAGEPSRDGRWELPAPRPPRPLRRGEGLGWADGQWPVLQSSRPTRHALHTHQRGIPSTARRGREQGQARKAPGLLMPRWEGQEDQGMKPPVPVPVPSRAPEPCVSSLGLTLDCHCMTSG